MNCPKTGTLDCDVDEPCNDCPFADRPYIELVLVHRETGEVVR